MVNDAFLLSGDIATHSHTECPWGKKDLDTWSKCKLGEAEGSIQTSASKNLTKLVVIAYTYFRICLYISQGKQEVNEKDNCF